MQKVNFIKTSIPEGQYRQKYEYGDMVVYHINAEFNKEMNAYECYECTLPKATFDETKVRAAFAQFSAKLDTLKLKQAKAEKIAEIISVPTEMKGKEEFTIIAEREQVPNIVKTLVENNIKVYEVNEEKLSLEDAFLKKTGGNTID